MMPGERLTLTVEEVARRVGGRLASGDPRGWIRGVAPVEEAGPHDLTMAVGARYARALAGREVGAVLVPPGKLVAGQTCIEVDEPREAWDQILELFAPQPWLPEPGIDPRATIAPDAALGEGVRIGAFAVVGHRARLGRGVVLFPGAIVGDDATIGDESIIHARAVVRERVQIGRRVRVGAGAVIGSEGFGFTTREGRHRRRPQAGTVIIEDDVEIGANACIDRASAGATVIGEGTKIDNLVQVAHNVRIGPHSLVVGQVGIAGSVRLGARVVLGGQVGVADHVTIGDGAVIAGRSVVIGDVEPGARLAGMPAIPHGEAIRVWALSRKLPELLRRLERLERRLGVAGEGDGPESRGGGQ
ncbi:UDP-3-O-(3-hydroxymyristoyl)glucosamine N-acyltransferase [Carboxydochorda subterranea]|uniref:UDP-3-O-acylglucosamine N-acyltransferase n=1 Tax=Carboxydichorda subterranea TaxID=3109565 RepID=A0ABZ1BW63_9FIRM|nr:UDP-3-O-(3-hydroxymyristoyl)glucosamine N-acyltransferase [Limnochorda sp. L945t]WRP16911.1 UDP-3-O-(3-hydroxymyristoyl)glucosamine N-acyltransferase [Limnochorda sp. L945t]